MLQHEVLVDYNLASGMRCDEVVEISKKNRTYLIGKFVTIDGLTSSAVHVGEITTLKHKLRNDSVG